MNTNGGTARPSTSGSASEDRAAVAEAVPAVAPAGATCAPPPSRSLSERPMHGYEMIQELEERTDGVWRPSPGAVYPALQLLEDQGLVTADAEAGKRLFSLTDTGREEAAKAGDRKPWDDVTEGIDPTQFKLRDTLGPDRGRGPSGGDGRHAGPAGGGDRDPHRVAPQALRVARRGSGRRQNRRRSSGAPARSSSRSISTHTTPATRREHLRLGLDAGGHEHADGRSQARVEVEPLLVAQELLDARDLTDPLHLDDHRAVFAVAAQQVDGADVGRVLASHEPQVFAERRDPLGQELLELGLDAVLGQAGIVAQLDRRSRAAPRAAR